ncbi:MAG TPA: hypothetical protein VGM82_23790 [Gemmatimonadaceae bacterium]|jgi:hypothetical protein
MRLATGIAAIGAAVVVTAGAGYWWQARAAHSSRDPHFGPATTNHTVAADTSKPLSTLSPPDDDDDPDAADPDRGEGEHESAAPIRLKVSRASAAVEQMAPGTKPAARLVASFDGLGIGFEGPNGSGRGNNPSDNSLAVGPNHIMQIVNGRGIAVYTKKGKMYDTTGRVLFGPVPSNNVFKSFTGNCEARNSGDVVVRYDQLADRWLIVLPLFSRGPVRPDQPQPFGPADGALNSVAGVEGQPGNAERMFVPPPPRPADTAGRGGRGANAGRGAGAPQGPLGPYSMCYAVSTTSDPLGAYYRYEFLRPYFPDYPRPAVWPDGYYIPTSTSDNRISPTVATQKHACVADRQAMLAGKTATEQCIIVENVNFFNNTDIDGKTLPPKGAPNIMIAGGGRQLDTLLTDSVVNVWQFHVDWKDPSKTKIDGPTALSVAPYSYLCGGQLTNCVPQPGTERGLDSQGDKIMQRLVYRRFGDHESILATHSIATAAGGGGVRWYEFRVDEKTRKVALYQQGTYLGDGDYRWMASGTIDRFGNIGMGYSYGGPKHFTGQRFSGRQPNDPLGQLTFAETLLAEGQAAQTNTLRWQDYTTATLDPSDDCTVWYVGDYFKKDAISYSTKIGAFRMPGCK